MKRIHVTTKKRAGYSSKGDKNAKLGWRYIKKTTGPENLLTQCRLNFVMFDWGQNCIRNADIHTEVS
jgi:hypothetical protein